MTNYEKYKGEIAEIASQIDLETGYIAVDRNTGKPASCFSVKKCSDCLLSSADYGECRILLLEWAASEAKGEKMNDENIIMRDKNTGGIADVAVTQVLGESVKAKSNKEILQRAIDTYGIDNQMQQTIEEMAELTQAICKYKRAEKDYAKGCRDASCFVNAYRNMVEETADCLIMLEQMKMAVGDSVNEAVKEKIERLERRLNEREKTE